jgi:hypothetical protein
METSVLMLPLLLLSAVCYCPFLHPFYRNGDTSGRGTLNIETDWWTRKAFQLGLEACEYDMTAPAAGFLECCSLLDSMSSDTRSASTRRVMCSLMRLAANAIAAGHYRPVLVADSDQHLPTSGEDDVSLLDPDALDALVKVCRSSMLPDEVGKGFGSMIERMLRQLEFQSLVFSSPDSVLLVKVENVDRESRSTQNGALVLQAIGGL